MFARSVLLLLVFSYIDELSVVARSLSCHHVDSSGCSYNISLQESCQLLAVSPQTAWRDNGDTNKLLQSIAKKVDKAVAYLQKPFLRASQADAGQDRQEGEPASEEEGELLVVMQQYINGVKAEREALRMENERLQRTLSVVTKESQQSVMMVNELFEKETACRDQNSRLLFTVSERDRRLRGFRLSVAKLEKENSQLLSQAEHTERQRAGAQQKLAAADALLSRLAHKLDVPALTAADVTPDVWSQHLEFLDSELTERLGNSVTSQLNALQMENARLSSSLVEKELALQVSTSCEEELRRVKQRSQLLETQGSNAAAAAASAVTSCEASKMVATHCSLEESDPTQDGLCGFERLMSSDFNWQLMRNKELLHTRYKTLTDHTCGSHNGRFIYLDLSRLIIGQRARLTSGLLSAAGSSPQCFSFWYRVHYVFNMGKFFARVLIKDEDGEWVSNPVHIWEQNLGQDGAWQLSKFAVPERVTAAGYKIQFTAEANGPGYVALDDLTLMDGPCY